MPDRARGSNCSPLRARISEKSPATAIHGNEGNACLPANRARESIPEDPTICGGLSQLFATHFQFRDLAARRDHDELHDSNSFDSAARISLIVKLTLIEIGQVVAITSQVCRRRVAREVRSALYLDFCFFCAWRVTPSRRIVGGFLVNPRRGNSCKRCAQADSRCAQIAMMFWIRRVESRTCQLNSN